MGIRVSTQINSFRLPVHFKPCVNNSGLYQNLMDQSYLVHYEKVAKNETELHNQCECSVFRKCNSANIVAPRYFDSENSPYCSNGYKINYFFDPISWKLSDIIAFKNVCDGYGILLATLQGLTILTKKFGFWKITADMVFSSNDSIKVWMNQNILETKPSDNFSINEADFIKRVLKIFDHRISSRAIQQEEQRKSSRILKGIEPSYKDISRIKEKGYFTNLVLTSIGANITIQEVTNCLLEHIKQFQRLNLKLEQSKVRNISIMDEWQSSPEFGRSLQIKEPFSTGNTKNYKSIAGPTTFQKVNISKQPQYCFKRGKKSLKQINRSKESQNHRSSINDSHSQYVHNGRSYDKSVSKDGSTLVNTSSKTHNRNSQHVYYNPRLASSCQKSNFSTFGSPCVPIGKRQPYSNQFGNHTENYQLDGSQIFLSSEQNQLMQSAFNSKSEVIHLRNSQGSVPHIYEGPISKNFGFYLKKKAAIQKVAATHVRHESNKSGRVVFADQIDNNNRKQKMVLASTNTQDFSARFEQEGERQTAKTNNHQYNTNFTNQNFSIGERSSGNNFSKETETEKNIKFSRNFSDKSIQGQFLLDSQKESVSNSLELSNSLNLNKVHVQNIPPAIILSKEYLPRISQQNNPVTQEDRAARDSNYELQNEKNRQEPFGRKIITISSENSSCPVNAMQGEFPETTLSDSEKNRISIDDMVDGSNRRKGMIKQNLLPSGRRTTYTDTVGKCNGRFSCQVSQSKQLKKGHRGSYQYPKKLLADRQQNKEVQRMNEKQLMTRVNRMAQKKNNLRKLTTIKSIPYTEENEYSYVDNDSYQYGVFECIEEAYNDED